LHKTLTKFVIKVLESMHICARLMQALGPVCTADVSVSSTGLYCVRYFIKQFSTPVCINLFAMLADIVYCICCHIY